MLHTLTILMIILVTNKIFDTGTWLNSSIEIFPNNELLIDPGGSSALSCTAPCAIYGSDVENFVFNLFSVEDGVEEEINGTLKRRVLSPYAFERTASNCTYTVNFSYPEDEAIRKRLDSVQCVFIYQYTGSNRTIHKSHYVNIIFSG